MQALSSCWLVLTGPTSWQVRKRGVPLSWSSSLNIGQETSEKARRRKWCYRVSYLVTQFHNVWYLGTCPKEWKACVLRQFLRTSCWAFPYIPSWRRQRVKYHATWLPSYQTIWLSKLLTTPLAIAFWPFASWQQEYQCYITSFPRVLRHALTALSLPRQPSCTRRDGTQQAIQ